MRHRKLRSSPMGRESGSSVSASTRRNFVQAAALRLVASIVQESLPDISRHALRPHRLRSAPCAERAVTDHLCTSTLRRLIYNNGGSPATRPRARDAAGAGPHSELGVCNVVEFLLENWPAGEMLQFFGACGGQGASRRR